MPINAGHEYFEAEKLYLEADTLDEKIFRLENLIRTAPKHKSSENLLKELKTRLKKLKEKKQKGKKSNKGKKGIRKEGFQCLLLGLPNSGKSSLLKILCPKTHPKISPHPFTTQEPLIGSLEYEGIKVQLIDMPSIGSENFDYGLLHTADLIIQVIEKISDLEKTKSHLTNITGKTLVIFNKADSLSEEQKRKTQATLKSKKIPSVLFSVFFPENLEELKKEIIANSDVIRVYTKEPGKSRSPKPIILSPGATVKDAAEKILKGFSKKVKFAKLTGPSGKFKDQQVGLIHKLKDLDTLEFHTR